MKNEIKIVKLLFIVLSIIIVGFATLGNIVISKNGGCSLFTFESFYVYIFGIIFSLYYCFNDKNPNGFIIASILTYLWTFYLVWYMLNYYADENPEITYYFYIYLSSSIFLILSLFFDNTKKNIEESSSNNEIIKDDIIKKYNINENNFLFCKFVMGFKEIPYDCDCLLVNNIVNKSIDLICIINGENVTKSFIYDNIKNISYVRNIRTSANSKRVVEDETKSILLSAVVFGGNPLLQTLGNSAFNTMFDTLSNNYDKINFNVEYEINIEVFNDNEVKNIKLNSISNPELFINQVLNK